jgi:hypothetical protein
VNAEKPDQLEIGLGWKIERFRRDKTDRSVSGFFLFSKLLLLLLLLGFWGCSSL